ncbi:MAG: ZPR1 zinc finger domain-containing protein [Candidatus Thorarchaeota archaeon]|nr:ZPR1 zinc finger domain-containing protein [Candidatus Thorarchaeota archaeon]
MPSDATHLNCPVCQQGTLKMSSMLYSVPYFNELAMFTMKCSNCNFTRNDVFSAEMRKPTRWTLQVTDESMLRIRVVRSGSGTIRMPEFGIDIEPGPAADAFITNVEGVLVRTRPVVEAAIRFAETNAERQRGSEVLGMIDDAIDGKLEFTLIIEDPSGVSGILPDNLHLVKREELSPDEASQLRGAPMWLDTARQEFKERKG